MERIVRNTCSDRHPVVAGEDGSVRTLRFGTLARQSCIDLYEPHRLMLPYTRRIMTGLLFPESLSRLLILGLGAGGMAQFLLHHHPHSRIDAVERCSEVITMAHDCFRLPHRENLRIYQEDALEFLHAAHRPAISYDVIFIDIYEPEAMAPLLLQSAFYEAALAKLGRDGVLAINLWRGNKNRFRQARAAVEAAATGRVLLLPVRKLANVILFAFPVVPTTDMLRHVKKIAVTRSLFYDLPLARYVSELSRPLRWYWNGIFRG